MADLARPAAGPVLIAVAGRASTDAKAVEELFTGCGERLGRFLAQLVDDRALAEDLLQDTFYDALRHRDALASVRDPEAWLFGIARHRALVSFRSHRRMWRAIGRLATRGRDQLAPEGTEMVAVRDLLQRHLKPEERSLLVLRYLHGYDAGELSAITGLSPEAVRQRLSRARARLVAASREGPSRKDRQ
jgi:RNA polymerase sigma-70 factor (ECF subfamily)